MRFALLLILLPLVSLSQEKKDTKVIVIASDTTNLFNRVTAWFYENGYSIDQKDESAKFIQSSEKNLKRWNMAQKFRVLIKGNSLVITGFIAENYQSEFLGIKQERIFNPVEFRGPKGNMFRDVWDEMERLAKDFGTEITYSK